MDKIYVSSMEELRALRDNDGYDLGFHGAGNTNKILNWNANGFDEQLSAFKSECYGLRKDDVVYQAVYESFEDKVKRLYPVGTKFISAFRGTPCVSNGEFVIDSISASTDGNYVYDNRKWAEIVKDEPKLKVGQWYRSTGHAQTYLFRYTKVEHDNVYGYGIDYEGDWVTEGSWGNAVHDIDDWEEASQEYVSKRICDLLDKKFPVGCKYENIDGDPHTSTCEATCYDFEKNQYHIGDCQGLVMWGPEIGRLLSMPKSEPVSDARVNHTWAFKAYMHDDIDKLIELGVLYMMRGKDKYQQVTARGVGYNKYLLKDSRSTWGRSKDHPIWDLYYKDQHGDYLRLKGEASAPVSTSKQTQLKEEDHGKCSKEVLDVVKQDTRGEEQGGVILQGRRSKPSVVFGHLKHREVFIKSKKRARVSKG